MLYLGNCAQRIPSVPFCFTNEIHHARLFCVAFTDSSLKTIAHKVDTSLTS